jgi:uncharacterized membrane protein YcaP (DUF421 family)
MDVIANMFVLGAPILEKIIRPIIIYLFLVIGLRLAGKRELAQLNSLDLVVLLTISNTVQNAIIGSDNSVTGGIIGAVTLLAINSLLVRFVHHNPHLNILLEGRTDVLVHHGQLNHAVMNREDISEDELLMAAHKAGFQALDEIQEATLEGNGSISFLGKMAVVAETHQKELLDRLDVLSQEMENLRVDLARLNHDGNE